MPLLAAAPCAAAATASQRNAAGQEGGRPTAAAVVHEQQQWEHHHAAVQPAAAASAPASRLASARAMRSAAARWNRSQRRPPFPRAPPARPERLPGPTTPAGCTSPRSRAGEVGVTAPAQMECSCQRPEVAAGALETRLRREKSGAAVTYAICPQAPTQIGQTVGCDSAKPRASSCD